MPQFQHPIDIPFNTWIKVVDAGVSEFTLQVKEGEVLLLRHEETRPTENNRGWLWRRGEAERDMTLNDISKGPGACVWAYGVSYPKAVVEVDHA